MPVLCLAGLLIIRRKSAWEHEAHRKDLSLLSGEYMLLSSRPLRSLTRVFVVVVWIAVAVLSEADLQSPVDCNSRAVGIPSCV